MIIDLCKEGFYGSPYIDFSKASGGKGNLEFLDSASFVLSTLFLSKNILSLQSDRKRMDRIRDTFDRGLTFINNSFIQGKGWSWGDFDKPDDPFVYCTWTAIECLTDLFESADEIDSLSSTWPVLKEDLSTKLDTVKTYYERCYIDQPKKDMDITKGTIDFGGRDKFLHYNLWIVITLLLLHSKKSEELEKAIDIIVSEFTASEKAKLAYLTEPAKFVFESKQIIKACEEVRYTDRAFLPLLLKCLCLYVENYPSKYTKYESSIIGTYRELLRNRDITKYDYVWDKYADNGTGYAIYYTERAIEALGRLYAILPKVSEVAKPPVEEKAITIKLPSSEVTKILVNDPDFTKYIKDILAKKSMPDRGMTEEIRSFKVDIDKIRIDLENISKRIDKIEAAHPEIGLAKDLEKISREAKRPKL